MYLYKLKFGAPQNVGQKPSCRTCSVLASSLTSRPIPLPFSKISSPNLTYQSHFNIPKTAENSQFALKSRITQNLTFQHFFGPKIRDQRSKTIKMQFTPHMEQIVVKILLANVICSVFRHLLTLFTTNLGLWGLKMSTEMDQNVVKLSNFITISVSKIIFMPTTPFYTKLNSFVEVS